MKKAVNHMIRILMLASGLILLLTVIIPHHHHADGMPCMLLSAQHASEEHDGMDSHHHTDCDCSGHTIVFASNSQLGHSSEDDTALHTLPVFILISYTCPPSAACMGTGLYSDKAIYIESLRDARIPGATGLRAPPAVIG